MGELFSKLGINWPVLVSQLISFLILLILLRVVAYKPILKMLDERSKRIKESLEQAETVKAQSAQAEDSVKKQLVIASQKGQEIIAQATRASEEMRVKAQESAKKEAEILIEQARQAIRAERDVAVDELRRGFADVTIAAAGKVIGASLDQKSHKALIDKIMNENQTLKRG